MSGQESIATSSYKKSNYCWVIAVASAILCAIGFGVGSTCFTVYIASLVEYFQVPLMKVTLYLTCVTVGNLVACFVTPRLIEKNAKLTFIVCSVCAGFGSIAISLMPSLPVLYVSGIIVGFGFLSVSTLGVPIILAKWFYKDQGKIVAATTSFTGVGGMIFSPVFSGLIADAGWQTAMRIMGVVIVTACVLASLLISADPLKKGLLPHGATAEEIASHTTHAAAGDSVELPGLEYKSIFKLPGTWAIMVMFVCMGVCGNVIALNNTIVQFYGFGLAIAGWSVTALSIGTFAGKLINGTIKDRFGATPAAFLALVLWAVGLIVFAVGFAATHNVAIVLVGAVIAGLGCIGYTITPALLVMEAYGPREYGKIFGTLNMFAVGGVMVGTVIAPGLFDAMGGVSYIPVVVLMVVLLVISMPLCLVGPKRVRAIWDKKA